MRFDEMFHEESRFQTKQEDKRRGDTDKCQVGKRQRIGGERGLMVTYICKYMRGNVTAYGTNNGKWKEKYNTSHSCFAA